MHLKKVLTAATCAVTAATMLASCGGSGATSPPASAAATPAATTVASSTAAAPSEPITLTFLPYGYGNNPVGDISAIPVVAEIVKQTNVKINIINVGSAGDMIAKYAALMATNDLPDIIDMPTADLNNAMYKAGNLEPLDDLLKQYAPNITANMPDALKAAATFYPDGKIHRLPITVGALGYSPVTPGTLTYARWDLYQKIGAPQPKTLEDLIPIAKQMLALEPTNSAGQKNYGFIPWFKDDRTMWWGGPAWMLGLNENTYCAWNTVLHTSYDPPQLLTPDSEAYQVLHFWYEANQAGLLDPDAAIMDAPAAQDKVNAGRAMMTMGWFGMSANAIFKQNGQPDKGFAMIKPPSDTKQLWCDTYQPAGTPGSGLAISSKCKDKVAAIKLLDYLNSWDGIELIYNGIKGVDWDLVDGIPTISQSFITNSQADPNWAVQKEGVNLLYRLVCISGGNLDPRYPADKSVFLYFPSIPVNAMKSIDPMQVKADEYYKVSVPFDLVTGIPGIQYQMRQLETPYMETQPQDMVDLEGTVTAAIKADYTKLIFAKDDADYKAQQQAYMDNLKKIGYDKVVQWYIDAQKRAVDKMNAVKG